jgi:hypothetical protein
MPNSEHLLSGGKGKELDAAIAGPNGAQTEHKGLALCFQSAVVSKPGYRSATTSRDRRQGSTLPESLHDACLDGGCYKTKVSAGIVVEGGDRGYIVEVCADPACDTHHGEARKSREAQERVPEQNRKQEEQRTQEITTRVAG